MPQGILFCMQKLFKEVPGAELRGVCLGWIEACKLGRGSPREAVESIKNYLVVEKFEQSCGSPSAQRVSLMSTLSN